ncbi:MAG TPA: hypothetical protein VH092_01835 [Urbifossiella sp.]|jgi:hypothetical protein|nr:hypothetical protein [Urbifossiella sp.]
MSLLKWAIAAPMLAVMLCDAKCAEIVSLCVLEGLAAGLAHGLVVVLAKMETITRPDTLTVRRIVRLVTHDARVGLVAGLMLGLTYAIFSRLS